MAITLFFVTEGADHLRVASVATLALIDISARQFQGGVGTHAITGFPVRLQNASIGGNDGLLANLAPDDLGIAVVLHRILQIEERHDLDQTAHGEDERDNDEQGPDIPLQAVLKALGWCVFSHVSYLG